MGTRRSIYPHLSRGGLQSGGPMPNGSNAAKPARGVRPAARCARRWGGLMGVRGRAPTAPPARKRNEGRGGRPTAKAPQSAAPPEASDRSTPSWHDRWSPSGRKLDGTARRAEGDEHRFSVHVGRQPAFGRLLPGCSAPTAAGGGAAPRNKLPNPGAHAEPCTPCRGAGTGRNSASAPGWCLPPGGPAHPKPSNRVSA